MLMKRVELHVLVVRTSAPLSTSRRPMPAPANEEVFAQGEHRKRIRDRDVAHARRRRRRWTYRSASWKASWSPRRGRSGSRCPDTRLGGSGSWYGPARGEREPRVHAGEEIAGHVDHAEKFLFVANRQRAVLECGAAIDFDPSADIGIGRLVVTDDQGRGECSRRRRAGPD